MRVVYVAGPFTAPTAWQIEQNVRRAEEAGYLVAHAGASPLIPHSNTRFFHGEMTPEYWYAATLALMERCHAVLMVDGWSRSKGATEERAQAIAKGLPVFEDIAELRAWLGGVNENPPRSKSPGATDGLRRFYQDQVSHEFLAEMNRALEKYPDCEHLLDGTGGGARKIWEHRARTACDRAHREGRLTHTHIFEEETAEAMAAETSADLRKELVQVGAMALKWILDIDSRGGAT